MGEHYEHKGAQIVALMRELRDMPERRVVDEWNSLHVSMYVYGRNHQDLTNFLDFFKNDPSSQDIWHQQNIKKQQLFHREVSRLLQNDVASVEALLEHTDTIYERLYKSGGKFTDYRKTRDEFRADPLVGFVKSLRNIVLHGETAKTMFRGTMSDVWSDNRVGIPLDFLKRHKNWLKGTAKQYLVGKTDYVDIPTLVVDYDKKVNEFLAGFTHQMQIHSLPELAAFMDKEREMFLLQIEDQLDGWFFNPDPVHNAAPSDFLFHGLFDQSEYDELDKFPKGSLGRGDKAVELLERHFPVPEPLKNKIRRAYADPNFFKWNALQVRTLDEIIAEEEASEAQDAS